MIPVVDDPAGMTDGRLRVGRNFGMLGPMIRFDRIEQDERAATEPDISLHLERHLDPEELGIT